MKKILLLIFMLVTLLSGAQVYTEVNIGEYAITTNNLGTVDKVYPKATRKWYAYTGTGALIADTVFYIPATASNASIYTTMAAANNKGRVAILQQRGTVRDTTITVSNDSIIFASYGTGAKPKIYGSEVVSGFTVYSGNIYRASLDVANVSAVFVNGSRVQSARIPKSGYFDVTSYVDTFNFRSNQLPDEVNNFYVNAVAVMRNARFSIETKSITASVDSLLTISVKNTNGNIGVGEGFFLTNKLEFLTAANEWYYDATGNYLYLWVTGGTDPDNFEVRASTSSKVIDLSDRNYVAVKNIEINHGDYGVYFSSTSDHNTVTNCTLNNQDLVGIGSNASSYTYPTITYNTISGVNGNAIRARASNSVINNNTISNTGLFANIQKATMQSADKPFGTAIYTRLDDATINYNRINNSGYNGIEFQGKNTTVKYNYVDSACMTIDDGGGIYCTSWGTSYGKTNVTVGSVIDKNVVTNVYGNNDGVNAVYGAAAGIYVDYEAWGVGVTNNVISGSTQGFYVNSGKDNYFRNNIVYDAMLGIYFKAQADYASYDNILFRSNKLFQTDRLGYHTWSSVITNQKLQYPVTTGDFFLNDSNTYIAPFSKSSIFKGSADFADWKSDTGTDANSTYDGSGLSFGYYDTILINETSSNKIIASILNADNITDAFTGAAVTFPLTLQPFTSKVVIYQDTTIINTIDQGLIVAPNLQVAAAPITDDSGLSRSTSGNSVTSYRETGNPGYAVSFNGTDARFSYANSTDLAFGLDSFSVELWINVDNNTGTKRIFHKTNEYRIEQATDGIQFAIYQSGAETSYIRTYVDCNFTAGTWYHIIVTYDGSLNVSGMKTYLNNVLQTTTSNGTGSTITGTSNNAASSLFVGGLTAAWFAGDMSIVRAWNKILTSDERNYLYNSGGGVLTTDF